MGVFGQRRRGVLLRPRPKERLEPAHMGQQRRDTPRPGHLNRAGLSPATKASPPRALDPHRIPNHHDPSGNHRRLRPTVTKQRTRPVVLLAGVWVVCVVCEERKGKGRRKGREGKEGAGFPVLEAGPPLVWVCCGGVLLSHTLPGAVPSALLGLASGFGMLPGVSPTL